MICVLVSQGWSHGGPTAAGNRASSTSIAQRSNAAQVEQLGSGPGTGIIGNASRPLCIPLTMGAHEVRLPCHLCTSCITCISLAKISSTMPLQSASRFAPTHLHDADSTCTSLGRTDPTPPLPSCRPCASPPHPPLNPLHLTAHDTSRSPSKRQASHGSPRQPHRGPRVPV
jgi:hypothetical protein